MTDINDLDNKRFASVLTVADENVECPLDLPIGIATLTTLSSETTDIPKILQGRNHSYLNTKGVTDIVTEYNLRELSLSYSFLSDDLLTALSDNSSVHLETLRVEVFPESKPLPKVSVDAWLMFTSRLPNVNLVVSSYLTKENDFEPIIASHVPVTHLYLGESTPSTIVAKIGTNCPRLTELVIGAYGSETLDQVLTSIARGCPKLSAVGLGECEVTCSGFVNFVELCCKKLQVLYIWETSLLEDSNYDVLQTISKVSSLLGRDWEPEYVPFW